MVYGHVGTMILQYIPALSFSNSGHVWSTKSDGHQGLTVSQEKVPVIVAAHPSARK